jgi:hypothetical protein
LQFLLAIPNERKKGWGGVAWWQTITSRIKSQSYAFQFCYVPTRHRNTVQVTAGVLQLGHRVRIPVAKSADLVANFMKLVPKPDTAAFATKLKGKFRQ